MEYLYALFAGIVLAIIGMVSMSRSKVSDAIIENNKVKEDLAKKDQEIAANNSNIQNEQNVRNQLKEDMVKVQNEEVTPDNIVSFFNNRK